MEIINLTPHDINFYEEEHTQKIKGCYYIIPGAAPYHTIPASGITARAAQTEDNLPAIDCNGVRVPLLQMTYGAPVNLPEPEEGKAYVVSALTVAAAKAARRSTADLYVVARTVRNEVGAVIGACALSKA